MSVAFILYSIELLANINGLAIFLLFILSVYAGITYVKVLTNEDEELKKSFIKKTTWPFIILILTTIILPSKETMFLMYGASALENSNLAPKVKEAIEIKLDDVIETLKKKQK